jgi:hypothetical protein
MVMQEGAARLLVDIMLAAVEIVAMDKVHALCRDYVSRL